jgi:glycyl-tRNA synthetase beta chain
MIDRWPRIDSAVSARKFSDLVKLFAGLQPFVDGFFKDVLVMADDPALREARLMLLVRLHRTVRQTIGDISEIAPEEGKQA